MSTIIQIKRSQTTDVPSGLANGEFAYSFSNDKLFIGQTDSATSAVTNDVVGGAYFTNMLNHAHGTLTGNSAIVVDTNSHVNNIITGGLKLTTSGGTANAMTTVQNDSTMGSASETALATSGSIKGYVDSQISAMSSDIDLVGDSGTDTYTTGGTLTFTGGTGLDTAVTNDTVTFNVTAGGIDTTQLADAAVTGAKIAAGTIAANAIASDAITTAKIDDGAVTAAKIAAGGLGANTLATNAVTTAKIADGNVTLAKIAAAAIVTEGEGIGSNDNDTTLPTSAAVKDYVDAAVTAEDLDVAGDSGTAAVDLDSQSFTVAGGYLASTVASGQTLTINVDGSVVTNTYFSGVVDNYLEVANTAALVSPYLEVANTAALVSPYLEVANASFSATDGSTSTDIAAGDTLTIQGTTNEVEVGESSGTFTVGLPDNVTINNRLSVTNIEASGNLTVGGTLTYLNVSDLAIQDPLIKLANNNTSDSLDIGFFGKFDTTKSAGLFRDATDGKFKMFTDLTVDPTTTVNTGGAGYAAATLVLGSLELGTDLAVAHGGTGASTFTSKGIVYGNGTGALQVTAAGTEGKILQAGSGGTPEFGDIDGGTF
jgi:hypothetical protein